MIGISRYLPGFLSFITLHDRATRLLMDDDNTHSGPQDISWFLLYFLRLVSLGQPTSLLRFSELRIHKIWDLLSPNIPKFWYVGLTTYFRTGRLLITRLTSPKSWFPRLWHLYQSLLTVSCVQVDVAFVSFTHNFFLVLEGSYRGSREVFAIGKKISTFSLTQFKKKNCFLTSILFTDKLYSYFASVNLAYS